MSINYRSLKIEHRKLIGLLLFFFFVLLFLPLAAQEKLTIDGNLTIKSADSGAARYGLVLTPQTTEPFPAQEGQLYYNDANNLTYYYNGATWQSLAGDKYVATKIVAASDSLDTICVVGSACSNPRADYTCNGTADGSGDQTEIQAAIDALGTKMGAVYLLEGTYNITGAINFNTTAPNDSGKAIIGTGRGTVLKVVVNTLEAERFSVIYAASVNRILISQLMIDGNRQTANNPTGITGYNTGINFYNVTFSKIDKVWVENIAGIISAGNDKAISIATGCSNNSITNCNLENSPFGILMGSNCPNNIITGNNVQGNDSHGIYLWSSGPNQTNNIISHNNLRGNKGYGISLIGSDSNLITNNNVQGNISSGIYLAYTGTNTSDSNTIANNNVQGNGSHGISLYTSSQNLISGNNVQGNNVTSSGSHGILIGASSSGNTVTGNIVYNNLGYSGIAAGSSNANIISYNRIYRESGSSYGIYLSSTAPTPDNNYLIGNLIDGAGYNTRIRDDGTNTKYTDKMKMTVERVVVVPTGDGSPLDVSTNPQGYIALSPATSVSLGAISDGKAKGDILILEGAPVSSTDTITIPHGSAANTILSGGIAAVLGLDDVLTLIWNGDNWVEKGRANNSP